MITTSATANPVTACCLADYLADALDAARHLSDVVDQLASGATDPRLAAFLMALQKDVRQDHDTLQRIATVFESTGLPLPERAPREPAMPRLSTGQPASVFRALEYLAFRVLEKRSLWDALALAADYEPRLAYLDYPRLQARAIAQHYAIERRRLELARAALIPR